MIRAELIRSIYTGGGFVPAGEVLEGDDAIHALASGDAIPVFEDRKIERAVSKRKVIKRKY